MPLGRWFRPAGGDVKTSNPANWAASPGGAGGAGIPTGNFMAVFDAASGPDIEIDLQLDCLAFNAAACAGKVVGSATIKPRGSFEIGANADWQHAGLVHLTPNLGTIRTNGQHLADLTVEGTTPGATLMLQDDLTIDGVYTVLAGNINLNGFTIHNP